MKSEEIYASDESLSAWLNEMKNDIEQATTLEIIKIIRGELTAVKLHGEVLGISQDKIRMVEEMWDKAYEKGKKIESQEKNAEPEEVAESDGVAKPESEQAEPEEEVVFSSTEPSKKNTDIPQGLDESKEQTEIEAKLDELKDKKFIEILGEMMKAGLMADLLQTIKDFRTLKRGAEDKVSSVSRRIDAAADLYGANKSLYDAISKVKGDYKKAVEILKDYYAAQTTEINGKIGEQLTNESTATERLKTAKTKLKYYKKTPEYKKEIKSEKYKTIRSLEAKIVKATKEHRLEDVQKMTEKLQSLMKEEPILQSIALEQEIAECRKERERAIETRKKLKEEARQIPKKFKEQLATEKEEKSAFIEEHEKGLQKQSLFGRMVGAVRTRTAKINGKEKMKKFLETIGGEIGELAGRVPQGFRAAGKGIGSLWSGVKTRFKNARDRVSETARTMGESAITKMAQSIVRSNQRAEAAKVDVELDDDGHGEL